MVHQFTKNAKFFASENLGLYSTSMMYTLVHVYIYTQFDGVHVVSGSLDTSIRVWDVKSGQCIHTLVGKWLVDYYPCYEV